jgi:hypothetical protein
MKDFLKVIGGALIVTLPFSILWLIWLPSLFVAKCTATILLLIGTIWTIEKFIDGR